ncbi:TonB-linked SusC/RagA family outer membrane protein [Parabacteroides sp. PFB2-12]|uniref:SusC/RagA family TonB-linked outer membrane protein n=1 Tax=unclassified Parabacteroides TaxID=2649774 RepID=UPI002474AF14|nr:MULTISPECIES: TonB-dependent receptor [unclassified Parabacteroides]MDH6343070.1 TonB-linked SusC/RagA family outer membrane protein [Parabacteroides sp. PM6-13]MDH6390417.1 TonB-linked SusC/RagA family outer membrane protein [Parabacteroides sp. PFB2-12]
MKQTFLGKLFLCLIAIFWMGTAEGFAQNSFKVTGTLKDSNGESIIGASIVEKGTTNGTVSDIDGRFTLNVKANSRLLISYVGYVTEELTAAPGQSLNIIMKEDSETLEEVVVVGYGVVKKSDLTGSVSSVSTKDLIRGGNTDAVGSLQGTMPGVQISRSSSKPGSEYNILIRGLNTISGSTSPLVVIDGVQGGSLSNINPDDIDRIDILKDASSTAIYGSRASNGVVLVTTKRGKKGDVKINYSGYAGFRNYTNLPKMMSGEEYVQLAREAVRTSNNNQYKQDSEIFTASELKAIEEGNYFDWLDAVSHSGVMTNHSISASGGSDISTYAISAGYYYEDGMIDPEEYSRYNLRTSVDVKPKDYLRFGINAYGTHTVRDTGTGMMTTAMRMRPTYHPTNLITGEEETKYSNGRYNPLLTQKNATNKRKNYNLMGNIYLEILPAKDLSIKTTFSPNIRFYEAGQYLGSYTENRSGNLPNSNYEKNSYTNWMWDNQISYRFAKKEHRFDVMGVFSMVQNQEERLRGIGNNLSYNSLWYNLQGGTTNSSTSGFTKTSLMSYLARANYSFRDNYFVTASIRFDGSSKLAEGNKWGSFSSAALAWRLSGEEFMKEIDWLTNLKLRLSYGQSGNDNVRAYQTEGSTSAVNYYVFGTTDAQGYLPGNMRNPNLGWERTTEYNIGLDFGLFDNRISGNIEYYNRLTKDLIMNKTIPVTTGYTSVTDNVGSVRNTGVEFMINSENIRTKDFSWTTQFNFAYNKNRIVDLAYKEDLSSKGPSLQGMVGDYNNLWIIGQPIDINFSMMTQGVYQLGEEAEAAKYGAKPGHYKPLDLNQDGEITDADRVINGKHTPDFTGGMTNTFTYRNLDFSFQMSFQTGAKVYNQYLVSFALEYNTQNFNNLKYNYWTPENPTNDFHRPSSSDPYDRDKGRSDTWNRDESKACASHRLGSTDYLKVNYISLGYTLNKNLVQKLDLSNLRVYATVQNPFIWTRDKYAFNPEQMRVAIGSTDFMTVNAIIGVNVEF